MSGSVGIGTSTPLLTATDRGNLTVNGISGSILTLGIANGYSAYFYADTTKVELSTNVQPMTFVTNGVERMRISATGNVGIGTSAPSQLLEVVGGEIKAGRVDSSNEGGQVSFGRATDNNTAWYIDAYGNVASPQLRFVDVTGGAVRMTVTGSRVGIGTSTPSIYSKLSVAGGISFNNNTDSAVASGEYGNAFSKTSSVTAGGSTVAIKPSLGPESSLMLVSGRSPTGNRFSDLILVIGQGTTAPTVVASRTYLSPSTRTYTNGGESLILQLTGGSEVYTVFVTGIGGTESA
jgi:hypothetical protein